METMEAMENMNPEGAVHPRIIVLGSACIVVSSLSPDDIRRFKDFHPEVLQLRDDESGEVIFSLDMDEEGPGSLNDDSAVYSSIPSAGGKATMTILLDPSAEDRLKLVEKNIGGPFLRLIELEEHLMEKLPSLDEEKQQMLSSISFQ